MYVKVSVRVRERERERERARETETKRQSDRRLRKREREGEMEREKRVSPADMSDRFCMISPFPKPCHHTAHFRDLLQWVAQQGHFSPCLVTSWLHTPQPHVHIKQHSMNILEQ